MATSVISIELNSDRENKIRQVKSLASYLSEVGGITSIFRTIAFAVMMIFHFRGEYQDMTQRVFVCEVDKTFKQGDPVSNRIEAALSDSDCKGKLHVSTHTNVNKRLVKF